MNLIIVESPTKAKTLSRFLGDDYQIQATMGHIKDLPKSTLGIDIDNDFKPDYQLVAKREKEIHSIKSQAKRASQIFLASDPDREGEAIAAHVKEILGNGKIKRIVFHEITRSAVLDAIKDSHDINYNLVNAQIARRVLDRLVGYKLSPLLWKKVRRGLSAGRVQSVTVRLIVEREREIKAFKTEEYWEIFCELAGKNKDHLLVKLLKLQSKSVSIPNAISANKIVEDLKKANYKVAKIQKRQVRKSPFPPFTTSTMTQAAARLFGWPAKRTMIIAQKLYEEGLITYHRTDSLNLSREALSAARSFISQNYGSPYLPEKLRLYKTKSKTAQEAHEAIRPTNISNKGERLEKDNKKLYDLIWRRFLACQMNPSVYDETKLDIEAKSANIYLLRASGQTMKFDGWRVLFPISNDSSQILPELSLNEPLQLIKVIPEQKFTQPPPRFNEASLIKTLEQLGIGRPSTYAPIISTIQIRNYVEKDEGKFFPTTIGAAVNDFLIVNFPKVLNYQFTASMEDDLDSVADGSKKWNKIIAEFYKPFESKLEKVEKSAGRVKIETEKLGKKCPACIKEGLPPSKQGELVIRIGRFGKFISCSRFPECKHTEKYLEKINMKCPECKKGDVVIKRIQKPLPGRRGRKFFGCSRYPDCKWASWKKPEESSTESPKTDS